VPVALVTGASSGIGRGLALRLAHEGWAVGLLARRREPLDELAAEIRARGGTAEPLVCDVGDRAAVLRAAGECARALGPVDLLVANAGGSENTFANRLDGAEVEQVMRVNFLGAVYSAESVLPAMLARRSGHLVVIGSLAGFGGLPLSAAYCGAKAALMDFFEALRLDLRGSGVDVTVIAPGYVRTPLTDRNLHTMPFRVELEPALDVMMDAIRARRRLVMFPWQLAWPRWIAQILPRAVYDRLASRLRREKRPSP
jgi:short-subunit dehydrogenase